MASEILLEGIIVVFHTPALAVGTHLEKTCNIVQRNQFCTTALIGLAAESQEMAATHTHFYDPKKMKSKNWM